MEFLLVILFGIALIVILASGIKIIRPVEVGIVEFLGKYSRTANAGPNWVFPGSQKMHKINITERRVDIDPQSIITKDKLNAEVDGVVYYRVVDAKKPFMKSMISNCRSLL